MTPHPARYVQSARRTCWVEQNTEDEYDRAEWDALKKKMFDRNTVPTTELIYGKGKLLSRLILIVDVGMCDSLAFLRKSDPKGAFLSWPLDLPFNQKTKQACNIVSVLLLGLYLFFDIHDFVFSLLLS